jgi:type I restriction enzyme R subunit
MAFSPPRQAPETSTPVTHEPEWLSRKKRIDPLLSAAGWVRLRELQNSRVAENSRIAGRTEEEATVNGPADYALWLDNQIVGVVEAKKLTVGPQNVLTQAERYARGLQQAGWNFGGLRCPFLYSTNGEVIWFHDVRHPLNRSRQVAGFHTAAGLREQLTRDFERACQALTALPNDNPKLRPYQREANAAIEKAIAERKRNLLVAMATGTGKTFTLVNQVYRLMKAGVAKRVLFLVDRRALAAQAVRAFSAFDAEQGLKFDKVYEMFSSRFQAEDFGDEEKFDPKVLPTSYLTAPSPGHAFVYVCTIQRMAINVLGREAVPGLAEEKLDEDVGQLDIPNHAFDLVVADECHRGYTAQELSVWRDTLNHFDAIRIGLTATPAAHTSAFFTDKVFSYGYEQAVRDGYLVDYDAVRIRSEVRIHGVFLKEGETVEVVDTTTGASQLDLLEDERHFDATELEERVTAPESNRKVLEVVKQYALDHEARTGRFPKTLIFAVNDLPHTSHADQLVTLARDVFGKGDAFVTKITGKVDRPLMRIREFRNRPLPSIVVTVDLLTTGVDIPDLEFIVLLRPVKSRILFEQMLGRGTRKGEKFPDKSHFTVFDCFDGTLLEYFRKTTGITAEAPVGPSRTIQEVIEAIWQNQDRDYNTGCLVKRLQRIEKEMSAEARQHFAAWVPEGDVGKYASQLRSRLRTDFVETMKVLRNPDFQHLLVNFPRPDRAPFLVAPGQQDTVTSELLVGGYKPEDYLVRWAAFVIENRDRIAAIKVLLDRPQEWSADALDELRRKLAWGTYSFTIEHLQRAHEIKYKKALADIISMVRHAVNEQSPLLSAQERTTRAFDYVIAGKAFTDDQRAWLDRIRQVMSSNLSIAEEDFDLQPALADTGGLGAAGKVFGTERLRQLLRELNQAIAA